MRRHQRNWRQWKDSKDLKEILTAWKSGPSTASRQREDDYDRARQWDRQVEHLDGIMDDIRQDFRYLSALPRNLAMAGNCSWCLSCRLELMTLKITQLRSDFIVKKNSVLGADERTSRALAPEASTSTNSATSAWATRRCSPIFTRHQKAWLRSLHHVYSAANSGWTSALILD